MADAVASVEPARVHLDVMAWRYECLEHAGYPVTIAIELAERLDVDLHTAVALLERGASVEQALAIMA